MDIKYTKSILKTNPDSKELADLLNFIPFILIEQGNITINPRGLKIIESQVQGRLHLVALQSQKQNLLYSLFHNRHVVKQERKVSGLWISSYPRYDKETNVSYLYLETAAINNEQRIRIHNICTLICSCVIVDIEEPNISYVTSLEGRVLFSRRQTNQKKNKENRKIELGNLALLQKSHGDYRPSQMGSNTNKLFQTLKKFNIFNDCTEIYKSVHLITLFLDQIERFNVQYLRNLQNQIKQICEIKPHKTDDLMIGPILSWYIQKVVQAINDVTTGRIVQIQKCISSIEVTEGYLAFVKASQAYHRMISKELREEGVNNLKQALSVAREEAIQQYRRYSLDAEYLILLGDHIDAKQNRLVEQNNKILDLKNINYLKNNSQQLLRKIARDKMDEQAAQKQIDSFVQHYKASAVGDNKYQLLTNYLKHLNAAVYKTINEKETRKLKQQIVNSKNQKRELQERVRELQARANRPPQNKCCLIM